MSTSAKFGLPLTDDKVAVLEAFDRANPLRSVETTWWSGHGEKMQGPQCEVCGGFALALHPSAPFGLHAALPGHLTMQLLELRAREGFVPLVGCAIAAARARSLTYFVHDANALASPRDAAGRQVFAWQLPEPQRTFVARLPVVKRPFVRLEDAEELSLSLPKGSSAAKRLGLVAALAREVQGGVPWWRAAASRYHLPLETWMRPPWALWRPESRPGEDPWKSGGWT